jgi:hypothetical protein
VGSVLVAVAMLAACGAAPEASDDDDGGSASGSGRSSGSSTSSGSGSGGGGQQGFVACGMATCQPGQHCDDELASYCDDGCQSNLNCAADQTCENISEVTKVGTCTNETSPDDQLARCQDACSQMASCGLLTAADGGECQASCAAADDATRRSVADCVEPWECESPLPSCLGIECGGSFTCSGPDETCVDGMCL